MQQLIVLGIIPGTNIQVGFFGWLGIIAGIFGAHYLLRRRRRGNALRILRAHAVKTLAAYREVRRIHIS